MYQRQSGVPRSNLYYRGERRRLSDLNRDRKNWIGVEGQLRKEPLPLVMKRSKRGEVHYVELKDEQTFR